MPERTGEPEANIGTTQGCSLSGTLLGYFPAKMRGGGCPSRAREKYVVRRQRGTWSSQSKSPALVLLERMMPGLDSFSAALDMRRSNPVAKIALLTRDKIPEHLFRAREHRLNGLIVKRDTPEELFYAIRTILNGGFYTSPSMSTILRDHTPGQDPLDALTQREKSVLTLYAPVRDNLRVAIAPGFNFLQ